MITLIKVLSTVAAIIIAGIIIDQFLTYLQVRRYLKNKENRLEH